MDYWKSKGCETCRQGWLRGEHPPMLAESYERHATLHQCVKCGTYWEYFARNANTISEHDVRKIYRINTASKKDAI